RPLAKRRRSCQRASVDVYRIPHEPIRDGRRIALVAGSPGKSQMYIQSLDALKASALTGTEGASWPFWSPDSRSPGFFAHGQLKRIDAEGGSPIDICEARVPCRVALPGARTASSFSLPKQRPAYTGSPLP